MDLKHWVKLPFILGGILFVVLILIDYFRYNELIFLDNFLQSAVAMIIITILSRIFKQRKSS